MNYIIILFGAATLLSGIIIVINPETVFGPIRRNLESLNLHILAVVVRIIIGVALIMYAAGSKYPTAILIVGWVSIFAAAVLGLIGRTNFKRLMSWALGLTDSFGRVSGLFAMLFGGFLIYAVL